MRVVHVAVPIVAALCIAATLTAPAAPIATGDQEHDETTAEDAARSATTPKPHAAATHPRAGGATTNSIDLLLRMDPQPDQSPQDTPTTPTRTAARPPFIASAPWEAAQADGRGTKDPGVQGQIAKTLIFTEHDAARNEGARATQQGHDPVGRSSADGQQGSGGFGVRPVAAGGTDDTRRLLDLPLIRFIRDHREMVIGCGLAALAAMWATASFRSRRRR